MAEEIRERGDWTVRRPGLEAGGWAFEYDNDLYPDIDDAAIVALALEELGYGRPSVERACRWMAGMQSSNGGWGAFDADNDAQWLYKIPFCDFGAVTDPPSADVTAHVVELLAREEGYEENVRRGIDYLLREQEEDGSWFGRWGVNYVYGTGAVLPALRAAGFAPDHPAIRRAVAWLEAHQNADGGFGEDCRSYDVGEAGLAWRGRGESTPSQTAWALLGLVAAGEARSDCARAPSPGWPRTSGPTAAGTRTSSRAPASRATSSSTTTSTGRSGPSWPSGASAAPSPREGLRHRRHRLRRRPRRTGAAGAWGGCPRRARRPPRPLGPRARRRRAATPSSTSPRSTATTPRPPCRSA